MQVQKFRNELKELFKNSDYLTLSKVVTILVNVNNECYGFRVAGVAKRGRSYLLVSSDGFTLSPLNVSCKNDLDVILHLI